MIWTNWLLIAAGLAGAYVLGLVGYKVWISSKKLRHELERAENLIKELEGVEKEVIELAKPNTGEQLNELLVNREQLKRARRHRAELRKRRLIERISSIEVDKR